MRELIAAKRKAADAAEEAFKAGLKCNTNDDRYKQGVKDAWEAAQRILGRMLPDYSIFDYCGWKSSGLLSSIVLKSSGEDAIEALRKWDAEMDRIKPGDEVYLLDPHYTSVVTSVDNGTAVLIGSLGKYNVCTVNQLHKTGRRFDEMIEVLSKLRDAWEE